HVVEEPDAGRNRRNAGPVEVDRDLDVGLLGAAPDRAFAHEWIFRVEPRLLSGLGRLRHSRPPPQLHHHRTRLTSLHARDPRMQSTSSDPWHGTTILTVRKGGSVVIGGDGQVSSGQTIVKANAKKVRRLGKGDVIGGFAGATADAFTLFERLEAKLEQYPGQLT